MRTETPDKRSRGSSGAGRGVERASPVRNPGARARRSRKAIPPGDGGVSRSRALAPLSALALLFALASASAAQPVPDRLDMETWLLEGHRITASSAEDPDSVLESEPYAFVSLDGHPDYEVVLLAERPDDRPNDIPPENSFLYVFRRLGGGYERVFLHDAGPGRFARVAFPDFDRDGTPEVLVTLSSAHAPDFDRFEIFVRGGFFLRPFYRRDRKLWLVTDLNGDGRPDLVTTHRVHGEEYLMADGTGFSAAAWESFEKELLARDLALWKKLDARRVEREKREKGEDEEDGEPAE